MFHVFQRIRGLTTMRWWGGAGRDILPSLPFPAAGSQVVVLGGGRRRRQKPLQDVLRLVADSIEELVIALRQLLIEVW